MSEQELQELFSDYFANDSVEVTGDGRHFDVRIISEKFKDLSLLQRQQLVYSLAFKDITSGHLHALGIQAVTPDEWNSRLKKSDPENEK